MCRNKKPPPEGLMFWQGLSFRHAGPGAGLPLIGAESSVNVNEKPCQHWV